LWITYNKRNNRADADSRKMMRIRILKSDIHIL